MSLENLICSLGFRPIDYTCKTWETEPQNRKEGKKKGGERQEHYYAYSTT